MLRIVGYVYELIHQTWQRRGVATSHKGVNFTGAAGEGILQKTKIILFTQTVHMLGFRGYISHRMRRL